MKMLLFYVLILLAGEGVGGVCVVQLDDMRFYKLEPFHCELREDDNKMEEFNGKNVPHVCIKQMQAQAREANKKGMWKAYSVADNGSLYEIIPVIPVFRHRYRPKPKSHGSDTNE